MTHNWISIKRLKPKKSGEVIVTHRELHNGLTYKAFYNQESDLFTCRSRNPEMPFIIAVDITHWYPIPSNYEQDFE